MYNSKNNTHCSKGGRNRSAFTLDEVKRMFKELPYNRIGLSIRLLLATGMKPKELLALEPHHISEDGSIITIEQELHVDGQNVFIGPTKTPYGCRHIPVPSILHMVVRELRNTCTNYIWEDSLSKIPCHPSVFRFEYRSALKAIHDIRVLPPYRCRHTYILMMETLGTNTQLLQQITGQASRNIMGEYLRFDLLSAEESVEALVALLS